MLTGSGKNEFSCLSNESETECILALLLAQIWRDYLEGLSSLKTNGCEVGVRCLLFVVNKSAPNKHKVALFEVVGVH
jgi:hypothetical protein